MVHYSRGMDEALKALFEAALAVAGDAERADHLIRMPIESFEGKSLRQLVAEGRPQAALDYLGSIESGFVG